MCQREGRTSTTAPPRSYRQRQNSLLLRFYDVLRASLELEGVEIHRLRTVDDSSIIDFELRVRRRRVLEGAAVGGDPPTEGLS